MRKILTEKPIYPISLHLYSISGGSNLDILFKPIIYYQHIFKSRHHYPMLLTDSFWYLNSFQIGYEPDNVHVREEGLSTEANKSNRSLARVSL
jgi:hypothetical protein